MNPPIRKQLPHQVPDWVDFNTAIFFVTICCRKRNENQLCHSGISESIFETVEHRHTQKIWYAHLFLLMPDHVHGLISFLKESHSTEKIIGEWKEWTAKRMKIQWQRGFFEHRLRKDESLAQKSDYILHNPVRAGLVRRIEEWHFVWRPPEGGPSGPALPGP